jgi:hypothetical protein
MQVTKGLASAIKQNNSAFLVKLPLELRHRVYELIFEDKVIAFMLSGGPKLRHCVCPSKGQKYHFLGYDIQDGSWCKCLMHDKDSTSKRLPLLLTCRQVYVSSCLIIIPHTHRIHTAIPSPWIFCGLTIPFISKLWIHRIFEFFRILNLSYHLAASM